MKMKIDMKAVINMIHTLKKQNTEQSEELLKTIQEMFAPLLNECEGYICAPTYDVDVDTYEGENKSEIDWEQRRYEIAKDCAASEINGVLSNPNIGAKSHQQIARNAIKMADTLIEKLKGESI